MASDNLSLEDIIKKKRIAPAFRGRGGFRGGVTRPQFKQTNVKLNTNINSKRGGFNNNQGNMGIVGDARNKIIFKKRTKITDAREKLAEIAKQRDAREKLDKLKMKKGYLGGHIDHKPRLNRGFTDITRQVRPSPLPPPHRLDMEVSEYDMDVDMMDEYMPPPMKIVRSINNDLSRYLPAPTPDFAPSLPPKKPLRDKTVLSNRQAGFNITVVTKNTESRSSHNSRGHRAERSRSRASPILVRDLSPQPVSILKKRPSMTRTPRSLPHSHSLPSPSSSGYRILVSNLQSSVTSSDIHELFGDIGELLDSRLVRPGTAEVIYSRLEDAQKAVDVYHNRQLDGQPMNCFLVNPRNPQTSSSKGSSSSKSRSGSSLPASSNSSVVPDVSTFYKVLFGKE